MNNTNHPSLAFIMSVWGKASEQFFMRQINVLHDAKMLRVIIITGPSDKKRWNNIPIISLEDNTLAYRVWHYFKRRITSKPYRSLLTDKTKSVLNKYKIDTLLVQFGTTAFTIKDALDPDKQRIFVHVHGHDAQEELCPLGYRDEITRLLSSRITTICNSYETFNRLTKWGVHTDNLVVKYMGVPLPEIETREHDNFVILFLGRLVDCKSPDRTIQAFELACEKGLKAQLIIAGDGPLRITCELLKARSKWKDAITMLGEVSWEQGKQLYEQADMFTQHAMVGELTGQVEAFGVSIVEAMAAALPVSTCLIGGISETVIEGETGLIFEPQNIEQQADTFLQLAHDKELRKRLGANARQRVKEHFSIDIEARNLLKILTQKD